MKLYWMTVGAGALIAVVGGVLWVVSDERFGMILVLGGLIVAIVGLMMRLIEWFMEKGKRHVAS